MLAEAGFCELAYQRAGRNRYRTDGSGWQGVYHLLRQEDFNVTIVQNPTLSLEGDAEVTRRVLERQDGPTPVRRYRRGGPPAWDRRAP